MNVHRAVLKPQPWSPADATDIIRSIAKGDYILSQTEHILENLELRSLYMGDVLYVLKNGFVLTPAQSSTRKNWFKYRIDSKSPNSGNRFVRVVFLPCAKPNELKLITVMWRDEDTFKG